MPPTLIVSDIDGTLLGDDASLLDLAAWLSPRRDQYRLAYSSGRFIDSVMQSIRETALPDPDFVIGGVGTEICDFRDGHDIRIWPGVRAADWSDASVRAALADIPRLVAQPEPFQSDWKVSYYLTDAAGHELAAIAAALARAGIGADLVYSSGRDLDVLPRGIDKGSAVEHLADRLNLTPDRVIVCGDTANDLAMFRRGFRGIVVGNAQPELRDHAGELAYRARAPYAAGVLEGLRYWSNGGSAAAQ